MPSYTTISPTVYAPGAPVASVAFAGAVKNNLDYLYGNQVSAVDSNGVPLLIDGSFESQPNGTPGASLAAWDYVAGTGGSGAVTNAIQDHGAQSFVFSQGSTGGNTGGTLTSHNYFNVSPLVAFNLNFEIYSSRNDVRNKVIVNWFNSSGGTVAPSTTAYDSGAYVAGPPAYGGGYIGWMPISVQVTPPATAVLGKVQLQGGYYGTTPPALTAYIYFDHVCTTPRTPFSQSTSFTTNGTWTIPAGVYLLQIPTMAGNTKPGQPAFIPVSPGQILYINTNGLGSYTISYNGTTYYSFSSNQSPVAVIY
jgi:hypothetical protein